MRLGARKDAIAVVVVCAGLLGVSAAPSGATAYTLAGDQGTVCTIGVSVRATTGINGLQLPHVGFSGEPVCSYALSSPSPSPGPGGTPASAIGGRVKVCKKKRKKALAGKKKPRRCGARARKRRRGAGRIEARVENPARLDQGVLRLIAPLGLFLPGDKSLTYLIDGGYSCVLDVGASCSDQGNLTPAIPLIPVYAEYKARFTAPAGENWVGVPAGCSGGGPVATCTLVSEPVTPQLI